MSNEHANNPSLIIHSFFSSSLSRSLNLQTFHYSLRLILCRPSLCALKGQSHILIFESAGVSLRVADTRVCDCCSCSFGLWLNYCHCDRIKEIVLPARVYTSGQGLLIITSHCVFTHISCVQSLSLVPRFLFPVKEIRLLEVFQTVLPTNTSTVSGTLQALIDHWKSHFFMFPIQLFQLLEIVS